MVTWYNDCYCRDSAEVLMELSTEKKNDLRKSEVSRQNESISKTYFIYVIPLD